MRRYLFDFLVLSFSVTIVLSGCKTKSVSYLKASTFYTPPASAGVYTWWHWMDGNITREGITRDLESMKKQGITGVTILNIGLLGDQDFGIPKVPFASPEWFDMFKWALHEANRLGLSIGAQNCDGWSTSGGPWNTPATSI